MTERRVGVFALCLAIAAFGCQPASVSPPAPAPVQAAAEPKTPATIPMSIDKIEDELTEKVFTLLSARVTHDGKEWEFAGGDSTRITIRGPDREHLSGMTMLCDDPGSLDQIYLLLAVKAVLGELALKPFLEWVTAKPQLPASAVIGETVASWGMESGVHAFVFIPKRQ